MASTSTANSINPSVTSTSSIDVASIVSGLMTVANKPLTVLQNSISKNQTIISDMGVLKSKISAFQNNLSTFENPSSYNTSSATSSNTNVVQVSAQNGAISGSYNFNLTQVAQSSSISATNFTDTATADINIDIPSPFSFSIGGNTFSVDGKKNGSSNSSTPTLTGPVSLSQLNDWINSVSVNNSVGVNSNIVQTGGGQYALVLNGVNTGADQAISINNLDGASITDSGTPGTSSTSTGGLNLQLTVNKVAQNAIFSINNLSVTRSSNNISDVISGVTLNLLTNLNGSSNALITVGPGTDNSSSIINGLITSYNDVISQYKSMTASSTTNPASNGTFANDPGMLGFIGVMKAYISSGVLTSNNTVMSLSNMGIDLQSDGSLKFNSTNFANAQSGGLLATLAAGVKVGGSVSNSNSLSNEISTVLNPLTGFIDSTVSSEQEVINNLLLKQTNMQTRLDQLQASYTQQYSTLNTLLYNLSQTSSQLTSSLAAITNINSGK
jgi:flagellar hook-associated protein 2